MAKAAAAEKKRLEKEAQQAHVAAMQADVAERNAALEEIYGEIDGLLAATLEVDDFVDLESLRVTAQHPAFDRSDLEMPVPPPAPVEDPPEPVFEAPIVPTMTLGRKKKQAAADEAAQQDFERRQQEWREACALADSERERLSAERNTLEEERLEQLQVAKREYAEACELREAEAASSNADLDQLIANLGYGTADAIEEYVAIVAANSVYPDHFPVEYEASFDPTTAELHLSLVIPPPEALPTTKGYKYTKSTDEITSTELSQKAVKDRYSGAVHQTALRSIHEVFESDRRGLIQTIAVQVGTSAVSPATGLSTDVIFVAAGAARDAFMELDLSAVVPAATLEHLGAAVSKNPYGLVPIKEGGVRKA